MQRESTYDAGRHRYHNQHQEQGVFLVLLSVVALSVFMALFLLGLNSYIVRIASSDLRRIADNICSNLSVDGSVSQKAIAISFAEQLRVQAFVRPKDLVEITKAVLVAPTMPSRRTGTDPNYRFSLWDSFADEHPAHPFVKDISANELTPAAQMNGIPFAQLLGNNPRCKPYRTAPSFDCLFRSNVDFIANPSHSARSFPLNLWNNMDNVGNTVGCELEAKVRLIFRSPVVIQARAAAWSPVLGEYPDYAPYQYSVPAQEGVAPGLTIAVATHLTTRAELQRFRFPDPTTPLNYKWDAPQNVLYNPLYNVWVDDPPSPPPPYYVNGAWEIVPPTVPPYFANVGPTNFSHLPTQIWSHDGNPLAAPYPLSPSHQSHRYLPETGNFDQDYANNIAVARDPANGIYSDFEEMHTACMNPVVLVRNILLSSLLELAGRNGQLRSSTELLLVGTQKRNADDLTVVPTNNSELAPPIKIVAFGHDLMLPDYQVPFVRYDGTVDYPALMEMYFGWDSQFVNPFYKSGSNCDNDSSCDADENATDCPGDCFGNANWRQDWEAHYAMLANQLRYCYHLYANSGANYLLQRYKVRNASGQLGTIGTGVVDNDRFEPDFYAFRSNLRNSAANQYWDQFCPWMDGCEAVNNNSGLNAYELASVLGSTQRCPYYAVMPARRIDETEDLLLDGKRRPCQKPDPTLVVAATDPGGPLDPGEVAGTFDLRPDMLGLIRYLAGDIDGTWSPGAFSGAESSSTALNTLSTVIIITHQRLSSAEADEIRDELANDNELQGRQFTIVLIPAYATDVSADVLAAYRHAFFIPDEPEFEDNHLVVLSPYTGTLSYPGTTDQKFQKYWMHLLQPNRAIYVVKIARALMLSKLRPERKL